MTKADERMQEADGYEDSRNMMWIFGQFLMIPIAAFVYSVEMLLRTMQGMQQATNQGMEVMIGASGFPSRTAATKGSADMPASDSIISNTRTGSAGTTNEEEKKLIDNNQNYCKPDQKDGKCLTLWRYKVLFIKRDLEHAFPEQEDLVPDDVTDLTAWKIAEFIQQLGQCKVEVPRKWIEQRYPDPKKYWRIDCYEENGHLADKEIDDACTKRTPIYLIGLPEEDKKFLRLYSQQLASYTRQEPKYEEQKIQVLKEIRDDIRKGSGEIAGRIGPK